MQVTRFCCSEGCGGPKYNLASPHNTSRSSGLPTLAQAATEPAALWQERTPKAYAHGSFSEDSHPPHEQGQAWGSLEADELHMWMWHAYFPCT